MIMRAATSGVVSAKWWTVRVSSRGVISAGVRRREAAKPPRSGGAAQTYSCPPALRRRPKRVPVSSKAFQGIAISRKWLRTRTPAGPVVTAGHHHNQATRVRTMRGSGSPTSAARHPSWTNARSSNSAARPATTRVPIRPQRDRKVIVRLIRTSLGSPVVVSRCEVRRGGCRTASPFRSPRPPSRLGALLCVLPRTAGAAGRRPADR